MRKRILSIAAVITASCVIAILTGSGDREIGASAQDMELSKAAYIPEIINYQGVLTDGSGNPLDTTVSMIFAIYDAQSGGNALWTETHSSVAVVGGLFTVLLGTINPIPGTVLHEPDRWLGLTVERNSEMARERLTSVPYAYWSRYADDADLLDGLNAADFATAGHMHDDRYYTKSELNTSDGTANEAGDPVSWYKLKDIPAAFADGHSLDAADGLPVDALYVDNDGNVGIGTTGPEAKLHIHQSGGMFGLRIESDGIPRIELKNTGTSKVSKVTFVKDNTEYFALGYDLWGVDEDIFTLFDSKPSGAGAVFNIKNGNVGIGTTNPSHPLHMGSGAHCTAGGVWTNASSIKYKENVADLSAEQAIQALECLNPVTFNYIVDREEQCVGFIAEDVPDLLATKDREGLSPMDMIAMLTKVVQEQQRAIEELKADMAQMKAKQ